MKSNTIGYRIKVGREKAGYTQGELGAKLGYSSGQFVSNWEGNRALPPTKMVKKLGKLLGMNLETSYLNTKITRLVKKMK